MDLKYAVKIIICNGINDFRFSIFLTKLIHFKDRLLKYYIVSARSLLIIRILL